MDKLNYACTYAYVHGTSAVKSFGRKAKKRVQVAASDESGMEIIAIVLILVIIIGLVIIFREKIADLFSSIWNAIFGEKDKVTDTNLNGG